MKASEKQRGAYYGQDVANPVSRNGRPDDDPLLDRGLPHDDHTERAVLGAILLDNGLIEFAISLKLEPGHFHFTSHKLIYASMLSLHQQGMAIDGITVTANLKAKNKLETVGGATYIATFVDYVYRLDSKTFEDYIRILKAHAETRYRITEINAIYRAAVDAEDTTERILEFSKHVEAANSVVKRPAVSGLCTLEELESIAPAGWLVRDKLARGQITMSVGESGSLKTFYALGTGLDLAHAGYNVVYVPLEGRAGIAKRARAYSKHTRRPISPNFRIWRFGLNFLDPLSLQAFEAELKGQGIDLIIFDTLSQAVAGADENSSIAFGSVLVGCQRLMMLENNPAIWLIHHPDKQGKQYRGHSSLKSGIDILLSHEISGNKVTITCDKEKDGRKFEPFELASVEITLDTKDEFGELETSLVLIPSSKQEVTELAPLSSGQFKILRTLGMIQFAEGATTADLKEGTQVPTASFHRDLNRLLEQKLVEKLKKGQYLITEDGKKASITPTRQNSQVSGGLILDTGTQVSTAGDIINPNTVRGLGSPSIKVSSLENGDSINDFDQVSHNRGLLGDPGDTRRDISAGLPESIQDGGDSAGEPDDVQPDGRYDNLTREGGYDMDGNEYPNEPEF